MKLLFTPFSILGGLIAGMIGSKIFEAVWAVFDDEEPPESEHLEATWAKVIIAALLQGAIFRATKQAVDRGMRTAFMNATGSWPGEARPDPE
jgi:Protein of unknown function (DUF4235)